MRGAKVLIKRCIVIREFQYLLVILQSEDGSMFLKVVVRDEQ
jgi:hypothetical protein